MNTSKNFYIHHVNRYGSYEETIEAFSDSEHIFIQADTKSPEDHHWEDAFILKPKEAVQLGQFLIDQAFNIIKGDY